MTYARSGREFRSSVFSLDPFFGLRVAYADLDLAEYFEPSLMG